MATTPEIDSITPANRSAVNQLREVLRKIGAERILVEVKPEYSVYESECYPPSVIFEWNVKISWGIENDVAIFLLFELEDREYCHTKYGLWEALAEISQKFYITAGYVVINDDGKLNLVETMCNAGISQY